MQVVELHDYPAHLRGAVIALGNFDGVHRGHQTLLNRALQVGETIGRPVVAITFEPHPRDFFKRGEPVFRLTPRAEKNLVLEAVGVDAVLTIGFDAAMAALEAEQFVISILLTNISMAHAVIGFNFHFGRGRRGTPDLLKDLGATNEFGVTIVSAAGDGQLHYSSSKIRDALARGDIDSAARDLGYYWFVRSRVVLGDQLGRNLGFPTANMRLPANCQLAYGIYAVGVYWYENDQLVHGEGVASYGVRPTFGGEEPVLETHLFNFEGDLYGKLLAVEFIAYLRPERKFPDTASLVAAMVVDRQEAEEQLTRRREGYRHLRDRVWQRARDIIS